jgi:hypothetical protein
MVCPRSGEFFAVCKNEKKLLASTPFALKAVATKKSVYGATLSINFPVVWPLQ